MSEQSYSHDKSYPMVNSSGALVAIAVDGANVARTQVFTHSFKLVAIRAHMQTAYVGATKTVLTVKREKEGGTVTNAVSLGTFEIPITAALGDVILANMYLFGDTDLNPGESINVTSDGGADATTSVNFTAIGYEYAESPSSAASFTAQAKLRSGTGSIKYAIPTEV